MSSTVNVGLNLVWIPRYGIMGAAFASLVSYVVETILIVTAFRWMTGASVKEMLVLRRGDWNLYMDLARRAAAEIRRRFPRLV